jgi:hypothetical protein
VDHTELIRQVDELEDRAQGYLTFDQVASTIGGDVDLAGAIADHVLLIDRRTRLDGTPVVVCRLNRRHPLVASLTGW